MGNTEPSDGLAAFLGVSTVEESRLWIIEYARGLGVDHNILMRTVDYLLKNGLPVIGHKKKSNKYWYALTLTQKFWDHYQVVANCHLVDEDRWDFLPLLFPDQLK